MVTVYHGTTESRMKQILAAHRISVTTDTTKRYSNTRLGYVYVTKILCDAMEFSSRTAENGLSTISVFRIRIDERELETDTDEKKWLSTLSPNGASECYRISRYLIIGKDIDAFYIKSFGTDIDSCGAYLQAVQYGEKSVPETEWRKL